MARKTGQIIRRGSSTWPVRIQVRRDPESRLLCLIHSVSATALSPTLYRRV